MRPTSSGLALALLHPGLVAAFPALDVLLDSLSKRDVDIGGALPEMPSWVGTHLSFQEGDCTEDQKKAITQAYKDANEIVNRNGVKSNIQWESPAGVEYLGPPEMNKKEQKEIQAVFASLAKIKEGLGGITASSNWIEVRCNDPQKNVGKGCKPACKGNNEDKEQGLKTAYSWNPNPKEPDQKYPGVNFCPTFFELKSLSQAVETYANHENTAKKYNVENYVSKATAFLHELFHMDAAADTVDNKPNPKVQDLRIKYNYLDKDKKWKMTKYRRALGAIHAKIVARFMPATGSGSGGWYVQRNADNLGRFALAKYVESKIDGYPYLPQVHAGEMENTEPAFPNPDSIGVRWMHDREKGVALNLTEEGIKRIKAEDDAECVADQAGDQGTDAFEVKTPHADDLYPKWYFESKQKWLDMVNQAMVNQAPSCKLGITQSWTCGPADLNLWARVILKNRKGDVIYTTPSSGDSPGEALNDNKPLELKGDDMKNQLNITVKHTDDYIQFSYEDSKWTSSTKDGAAHCKLSGDDWNKNGPEGCPNNNVIMRQFECQFPCAE